MVDYVPELNDDFLHQIKATGEIKKIFDSIVGHYSDKYQKIVLATYESPEVRSLYTALRTEDQISKKKTHRQLIKFPNAYVLHFLDDQFSPKYGPEWLSDKKTLIRVMKNEDLIKPWITVHKI